MSGSSLITLDWSEDSCNIAAVTADFNLIHADVKLQRLERRPDALRDQTWLDQTCTMGYNVAGTWNNLGRCSYSLNCSPYFTNMYRH